MSNRNKPAAGSALNIIQLQSNLVKSKVAETKILLIPIAIRMEVTSLKYRKVGKLI